MAQLGYRLFDADNHYYETRDCFTRHLPARLAERAIRVVPDAEGRDHIFVGERPFTFLENWSFRHANKPGALRELLRRKDYRDENGALAEPIRPEYQNRDARLALMDAQGLEASFLFPTLAVCVEHFMKDDPEQLYGNLHAFNEWLDEEWGFAWRDRIYAVPLLSLRDRERAVAELDWALAKGARVVSLRPGPAFGRSPGDPWFDPFWARVNESGVCVAFHIGESGYNEMMSVHYGEQPNPSSHKQSAFQWSCCYGDRPIMDTVASLVFSNLFGRFPNVRIASVENGSLFVPYLMAVMDKMGGMGRNGPWPGGRIREKPSAIIRRHLFVSPYHEEDIPALARALGASQVLFGSDFPHPEGLAEPAQFAEEIAELPAAEQRMILRDNALRLVGRAQSL
jgi:predicted TIM-barrel fold metal-dependent hydrolase